MNKKYFVMIVSGFFMMATVTSCGDKNNKKEKEDTEQVEDKAGEAEVDTEEAEDVVVEKEGYKSQDLATFDLRGQVIAVKYTGDETIEPVVVQFSDDSKLKSIVKYDVEGNTDEASVERDGYGRIETISFESLSPWVTTLSYGAESMLPVSCNDGNQMGNYTCMTYERDPSGDIVKVEFEEGLHGYTVDHPEEIVITLSDYDSHGNWLLCKTTQGTFTSILKRSIVYKGEKNIFTSEL